MMYDMNPSFESTKEELTKDQNEIIILEKENSELKKKIFNLEKILMSERKEAKEAKEANNELSKQIEANKKLLQAPTNLYEAYTKLQEDLKSVKTFLNKSEVTTNNIISDKQFSPLVTLINIMNPNDQLDPAQIARHNKERSNNKNGSSFTSYFKKTKGGKHKTRKSKYKNRRKTNRR